MRSNPPPQPQLDSRAQHLVMLVLDAGRAVRQSDLPEAVRQQYRDSVGAVLRSLGGCNDPPDDDPIVAAMRRELRRLEQAGDDVHAQHLGAALERHDRRQLGGR